MAWQGPCLTRHPPHSSFSQRVVRSVTQDCVRKVKTQRLLVQETRRIRYCTAQDERGSDAREEQSASRNSAKRSLGSPVVQQESWQHLSGLREGQRRRSAVHGLRHHCAAIIGMMSLIMRPLVVARAVARRLERRSRFQGAQMTQRAVDLVQLAGVEHFWVQLCHSE